MTSKNKSKQLSFSHTLHDKSHSMNTKKDKTHGDVIVVDAVAVEETTQRDIEQAQPVVTEEAYITTQLSPDRRKACLCVCLGIVVVIVILVILATVLSQGNREKRSRS